jgi:cytochrome c heme-lyase
MGWFSWGSSSGGSGTSRLSREEANALFSRIASGKACTPSEGGERGTTSSDATSPNSVNPSNMMPDPNQRRASRQSARLSKDRVSSSIPISERNSDLPEHQRDAKGTWKYPSEQMFYNAILRKGWTPEEKDMSNVIAIHNAVNERCWQEVLKWERLHAGECDCPKLLRFRGRPRDYSPKARFLNFLGFKLPFDRHDWVVDRCGRDVRYVIDFYNAKSADPRAPVAMHLDARPALDSLGAAFDRAYAQAAWTLSGEWLAGRK